MCGIAGVLDGQAIAPAHETVEEMIRALVHRGPDDSRVFVEGPIALAVRRLAIVDIAHGQQPMQSNDGRFTIAFNGEIYNHLELRRELESNHHVQFKTHSDTEALLQAYAVWGTAVFPKLAGMFALAVWDAKVQELVLARDRCGEKPLYFHKTSQGVIFASEIKALLKHPACPRQPSIQRIVTSLSYRFAPGTENYFEGIEALPPAHWMKISEDGTILQSPVPYWNPPCPSQSRSTHSEDSALVDKLDFLVRHSVKECLSGDVPVGAFLSGGVDSSMVVAIMAELASSVRTFSIGFDSGFSEHQHAANVAKRFGTIHETVTVSAEDILAAMGKVIWYRESPISEPSDIPIYLLSQEAARHVKVVLGGEGSDELFGGYPKYAAAHWLRHVPAKALRNIAGMIAPTSKRGLSSRSSITLESLGEADPMSSSSRWFGAFDTPGLQRLLARDLHELANSLHSATNVPINAGNLSRLENLQRLDFLNWLPANLLLRSDRLTMAHSLELRSPFLHPAIVDFAFSEVADRHKVLRLTEKWLIRQVAKRYLPPKTASRPKWGFKVPIAEMLRGRLLEPMQESLLSADAVTASYYQHPELKRLIQEHTNGRDHSKQLWFLWQLELWHRSFLSSCKGR